MQKPRREHDYALNDAKDNDTTGTIEELDKLRQILQDKYSDAVENGEEHDIHMEYLNAFQHSFNKQRVKSQKGD